MAIPHEGLIRIVLHDEGVMEVAQQERIMTTHDDEPAITYLTMN